MKKIGLLILFILCFAIAPVYAEDGFTIDNTRIITADKDATYIEGSVNCADGQKILVKQGLKVISEKTLPVTGAKATFRIKIPKKNISTKRLGVYHVIVKDKSGTAGRERVEISFIEREKQNIKTDKDKYELTFPGYDQKIEASSESEENLIFSSSNPNVVRVDDNGKLVASGGGEAEIKIKQIGSSQFFAAEKTVKVSVEKIDAYTITYHSSGDESDETTTQIIPTEESVNLEENTFENGDHQFLGWARSDDGLVEYTDSQSVSELGKTGEDIDLYAVWTGDGARAAVAWACMIANDDSFNYGQKPETSSMGCYFCGTNQRLKPSGFEKTYVCLTFVTAAYAHGAEDPEMLRDCRSGRDCVVCNDDNFYKYSCWKKIGYCSDLSINDLKPGDVISWYNEDGYDNGHVAIYAGDNKIVDAEGIDACWSPASIAVRSNEGTASLRDADNHHGRSYVMRYVGVNAGK